MDCTFYHTLTSKVWCITPHIRKTMLLIMVNDMIAGRYKRDVLNNLLHQIMFVEFGGLEQDITEDKLIELNAITSVPINITHGKKIFGTEINGRKNKIIYTNLKKSVFEKEFRE